MRQDKQNVKAKSTSKRFLGLVFIIVILWIACVLGWGLIKSYKKQNDTYKSLKDLAGKDAKFAEVYRHKEEYPDELLSSLIHNTEMLEFVRGYLDADSKPKGVLTEKELSADCPMLCQWDERWGGTPIMERA